MRMTFPPLFEGIWGETRSFIDDSNKGFRPKYSHLTTSSLLDVFWVAQTLPLSLDCLTVATSMMMSSGNFRGWNKMVAGEIPSPPSKAHDALLQYKTLPRYHLPFLGGKGGFQQSMVCFVVLMLRTTKFPSTKGLPCAWRCMVNAWKEMWNPKFQGKNIVVQKSLWMGGQIAETRRRWTRKPSALW